MEKEKLNDYLIVSAQNGMVSNVQDALQKGAFINATAFFGKTPLMLSCMNGHYSVAKILLEKGADFRALNKSDWTALHFASCNGHADIVELLTSYGANIDASTKFGNTPFMLSSMKGHCSVATLLLKKGANWCLHNIYQQTALHLAAKRGQVQMVTLLTEECHADLDVKDKNGYTPFDIAEKKGHQDIVQFLTDKKLRRVFKQGLHEGNVYITNIRLILMGPPCVGKTALKSLLFNWPAPKGHNSTALATRPIRATERVVGRNEEKIWERITSHDLYKMLSDAIHALETKSDDEGSLPLKKTVDKSMPSKSTKTSSVSTSKSLEEENVVDVSAAVSGNSINDVLPDFVSENDIPKSEVDVSSESSSTAIEEVDCPNASLNFSHHDGSASVTSDEEPLSASQEEIYFEPNVSDDAHSKEIIDLLAKRKKTEQLHKATWIYVIDSGGQPQFADISRAFLHGNTVYLICTKLTERLSDKPKFVYSINEKVLNQPKELQMTNLQLIEYFVRSVVASKSISLGSKPLFAIIGTYFDELNGWKNWLFNTLESLATKNEQLLSVLSEFRDHLIFYNDTELIIPVNNLCRRNREEVSSLLRQRIMSHRKDSHFTVPIPVRWYFFEMRITEEASQQNHGMISLERCCKIGTNFAMTKDDVIQCVTNLNSMTLFLYFHEVLPNVIFTDPQYLLDMLTTLIQFSFVDLLEEILPNDQSLEPETQRVLREDGVFDVTLLDKLCLPFISSLFTRMNFLELLRYLRIIAPLTTTDTLKRYFIPVVLPPCQPTKEDIAMFTTTCDPMIIAFEGSVVPQGVFPACVVALVSRKRSPKFFISCSPTYRQLRYAVLLYSEDLFGSVLLVDQFYWIEVYYNGLTKNCFKLRQVICQAISTCEAVLDYAKGTLNAEVTVPCQQQHQLGNHKLHPVILSLDEDPPAVRCSVEKKLPTIQLTNERQTCWLIDTSPMRFSLEPNNSQLDGELDVIPISSTIPDGPLNEQHLSALVMIVKEINEWEILGVHLGVRDAVIKEIKAANYFQPGPSRKDMLVKWLKGGKATRAHLIEALKKMDENDIVQRIKSTTAI